MHWTVWIYLCEESKCLELNSERSNIVHSECRSEGGILADTSVQSNIPELESKETLYNIQYCIRYGEWIRDIHLGKYAFCTYANLISYTLSLRLCNSIFDVYWHIIECSLDSKCFIGVACVALTKIWCWVVAWFICIVRPNTVYCKIIIQFIYRVNAWLFMLYGLYQMYRFVTYSCTILFY